MFSPVFCVPALHERCSHRGAQMDVRGNQSNGAVNGRSIVRSATRDGAPGGHLAANTRTAIQPAFVAGEHHGAGLSYGCIVWPHRDVVSSKNSVVWPLRDAVSSKNSVVWPHRGAVSPKNSVVWPHRDVAPPQDSVVWPHRDVVSPQDSIVWPHRDDVSPKNASAARQRRRMDASRRRNARRLASLTRRSQPASGRSHAKSPPPGFRSTVFR